MLFNEIKCHVNTSLGLVGGMHPLHSLHPPCVRAWSFISAGLHRDRNKTTHALWPSMHLLEYRNSVAAGAEPLEARGAQFGKIGQIGPKTTLGVANNGKNVNP